MNCSNVPLQISGTTENIATCLTDDPFIFPTRIDCPLMPVEIVKTGESSLTQGAGELPNLVHDVLVAGQLGLGHVRLVAGNTLVLVLI